MRKLLLFSLMACCIMISSQAIGQYYNVDYSRGGGASLQCNVNTTTFAVTTSQTMGFGVVNSWTNYAPGGTFSPTGGAFTFGEYWTTPGLFNPMSISVNAGYTADVHNTLFWPATVRMALEFRTGNGQINLFYGPYVTIAGGETATLSIPAGSCTYTVTPGTIGAANPNGFPTPLELLILD